MKSRTKKRVETKAGPRLGDRLSSPTENYLLSLYVLKEEGTKTTLSPLAEYLRRIPAGEGLGTSLPSVAGMVGRMQREGLVTIGDDKEISLTDIGLVHAEDMVRRHRLAERLVVDLLGVDLHRAHIEAHRLEHAISPELQTRIAETMGMPTTCPFGHPIPGIGDSKKSADLVTLDAAKLGIQYLVDRVPEENEDLLKFLIQSAIIPKHVLTVREVAPYRGIISIETEISEIALGYEAATRIWVRPS